MSSFFSSCTSHHARRPGCTPSRSAPRLPRLCVLLIACLLLFCCLVAQRSTCARSVSASARRSTPTTPHVRAPDQRGHLQKLVTPACVPGVKGWDLVRNAVLRDVGFAAAAIPLGRHILVLGGVTDLPSSVDVFNYTMHHTKRGVNLFEPTEGRVEVATEVRPNRSSLRCPLPVSETYALHKLPSSTLKTNGAAWQVRDDVPQRCIEAARENSTADAVLPFPVVGSGSVVRVRNRVYALGACNTIPPEVSLDLLRATENRKGGVRGARAASSANSAAPSPQVRLVEDYLRSVTRLQLYANANASVLHQHVIYQPPSMTLRFNATCVAGPRGTVYIVGGTHARTGESLASVAQFDTATETFVEGVWSLDTPVVSPAAASDSGLVFFAGGFSAHDTPTFFDPSRQRRDYHTQLGIVAAERGVLDSTVARYASNQLASELQWTAPQLFVRGAAVFMLGAGGRRPHGGVACWANMSIPLAARPPPLLTDRPRVWPVADLLAPDGVEAETQTDKAADAAPASKDERDGVFSYIDFALVPARRDAVVALWPSPSSSDDDDDGAATVSFYLFGGRSPPLSRSDRGAAATEVFKATFYACSESGTPQEDADVSAASPKLLGLSYTRVIHPRQHEETATSGMAGQVNTAPADSISTAERIQMTPAAAADAAAIPNNNGSTCVAVNGYTPLWYNISFSVLLSHVETERACPGISQSSDAPASFSACSLMLSASPQCDEPIVELRHLSPRNARVVTVPVHNEVGDVTGTQRAFAVAQTLLIGSLEHGLMRVMAAGEEGRSIGSSIRNASDNYNGTLWKTVAYRPVRLRAASRQVHRQRSPSHDDQDGDVPQSGHLLYYPQDFVHVCLSLRPGVIASCGASHQRRRSELFSASLTTTTTTTIKTVPKADGNGTREVKADRYRAAACSTRFYETLSPHQPFVLSPELPCCSEKDSSSGGSGRGGDDDDASPLIPTPHRLLRSWMLLTTLIVLLVMIVGYIVVTFVVMPGYVRHRTRRHDVAFMDTPDPDQQRSLVPYREARIFLGVDGGFGAGGTVGFAGGAGGIAGGECNYMDDDLPEEYETALNAAGVGGGGLAGFGAAWDSAVIATPPQQRRRLLDGKYEVIRKLGKGSFSVVYLVRRITDNTTYALKYVQCSDDVDRHEAMKECEVVYALQGHPNVIQLFDMFMSYRFDRHMVTVPRSRRSRGAADTVRVTGEKEKQKTSKKEGGGNPQQPQQEEAARSAGVDEEAGAEANAAGNRGNSPCLLPSPPSASSATTITSTTPRAEASPHDASTAAATEAAARGNSIDNSKPTLRCERQGREYSRSAATNDNAERTGFTSAVGPVVVAAAQQSSLHGAFSSTSTFAETSATSRPVVHLDSTYFDAVTAGVLRDDNTESSTTPPPQRQQQQRTESATAADTQAATDAVAPHHHHHRGLSSLQAERYLSLVMAYHERGDLARWVRQRRALQPFIPEATVVSIAFQVLSLLSYMHHRHQPPIIHRDLKPENILLSTHVHYENVNEDFLPIVVTDFGLSRVMDKTFCETGVGSLPYVAPECWQRRYSAKVDIWALGCVLYAVCAKRVDSSNVKVMFSECAQPDFHAQLRHELESIYGYSDALAWFITALLAVKPDDRPSAVEALGMLRRHPTNEEGEPLFQRAPLAALLRAAPPQQPEEQEENDGGVRSGVVDLVDHASQQSSPYQRRATTREGPAPLPAMHVASARPASFVSTPTPSDWEAANAAPVEDAEAAVPFASAVSQTPQQQPQRQRNHQRECESDSTGFLAATARAHEGQPTDGPRKAPQQESEEDKSGEGVRSAVVVVSSLSLSGPPSTRVASTQPPHSAQRTQWRSADDHPEDEEQGKEDAL